MALWEELFLKEARSWVFQEADPHDIAEYILVGLGVNLDSLIQQLEERKQVGTLFTGTINNVEISVTHRPGGALQVESLIRVLPMTKAQYVIGIGAAGGLQEEVEIGNIILPDAAVRGESLTNYYYPPDIPAVPDHDVLGALVQAARRIGGPYHSGLVWSVASQLHETEDMIQRWQRLGILGVECETAALFLLSRFCGLKAGVVLAVSDSPLKKQSHEFGEEFDIRWKEGLARAVQIAVNAVKALHEKRS
ncbi:hypothetical protein DRP53_04415 [candidate division WOR-3 bacterium]|uniref:Uridine phosphorylase n=1 Tax=candidate division WOR-3 bacterium TaxID=2052148 RepID=A0A660SKP9_UNCW3|nr:MAG: hypothetical protein DRP53_04415 [candidate division WOR-3 bacterium]